MDAEYPDLRVWITSSKLYSYASRIIVMGQSLQSYEWLRMGSSNNHDRSV